MIFDSKVSNLNRAIKTYSKREQSIYQRFVKTKNPLYKYSGSNKKQNSVTFLNDSNKLK